MCIRHMQYDPSSKSILSLPFQVCVKQNKQFLVAFCLSKYSWCMDFQCRVVVHLSRHYMFRENWLFSSENLKFSLVLKQWVLLCAQLPWPWLYLVWLGPVYLFFMVLHLLWIHIYCSSGMFRRSFLHFLYSLFCNDLNFRGFMKYIPGMNFNSNILCLLANCGTLF